MKKINLAILGGRPEAIKFFPLFRKMPFIIVNTGQQRELSKMMLDLFNIVPDIDLDLMKKNQSICGFLARAIKTLDDVIKNNKVDRIWVQGDTMTALAGALVAKMNNIELVHLEAGLRTFDNKSPFPEEMNRILIDQISDILFAPTKGNVENLKNEGVKGKIYLVGNTVVDALKIFSKDLWKHSPQSEKYVLATVHRRETIGNEMEEIFKALKELNKEIKVIIPIHPNPNVKKLAKKIGIKTIPPLNYFSYLNYLKHCEYICSDSGAAQEEPISFGKKVIILRKITERPEIIRCGYGIIIDKLECSNILKNIKEFSEKKVKITSNPFGNGNTAEKIVKIIKKIDGK